MKNAQKRLLITLIVIIAIIIGGVYYFSKNKTIETKDVSRTYSSEKYGFAFNYPEGFVAEENDGDGSSPEIGWIRVYCSNNESDCAYRSYGIYVKSSNDLPPKPSVPPCSEELKNSMGCPGLVTRGINIDNEIGRLDYVGGEGGINNLKVNVLHKGKLYTFYSDGPLAGRTLSDQFLPLISSVKFLK